MYSETTKDQRNLEPNGPSDAGEHRLTPGLFSGQVPLVDALAEMRVRLLDLSGRNRLVNFRHSSGKSLQFIHSSLEAVLRHLLEDVNNVASVDPLPEPPKSAWTERSGKRQRPDPKDWAPQQGLTLAHDLPVFAAGDLAALGGPLRLRTAYYEEDLALHCRKLEREAKSAIEETGANMLHIVFGFLEYTDSRDSAVVCRAPLVSIPVRLVRTQSGPYDSFHVAWNGDEVTDNLSLHEKLKREHGLTLPSFDPDAADLAGYLAQVAAAIHGQPDWKVRRWGTMTLLSFANMLLVRDLDPAKWTGADGQSTLLTHPIIRQVFEGRGEGGGGAGEAGEYPIDDHPRGNLPLVYDADSSQHSALIDVLEGRNAVIEGPPGTGKSQTITNLIAAALHEGKRVLFVAEKLAALSVVRSRLQQAGLHHFVLELHSNKAEKKQVIKELADRVELHAARDSQLPALLEQQAHKRNELKAYADLVNSRVGNALELTLYQVFWRSERHRLECGLHAARVQAIAFTPASRTSPVQLAALCERVRYLAQHLELVGHFDERHALWGFFPSEFRPEDDLPVQQVLRTYAQRFADFGRSTQDAMTLLGMDRLPMSATQADQLLSLLETVSPADAREVDYRLLPALMPGSDPTGKQAEATLEGLARALRVLQEAEGRLQQHLLATDPVEEPVAQRAATLREFLRGRGLDALTADDLEDLAERLEEGAQMAADGLSVVASFAQRLGLLEDAPGATIRRVAAVLACLEQVPRQDALAVRHEGLRIASAAATLRQARDDLGRLQQERQQLAQAFYTDLLAEEALKPAILTLREGDAWYRVFQGRWRAAIAVHRQLQREKRKVPAGERLVDLERLLQERLDTNAWQAHPALRAAAGPHFQGEATALDDLVASAEWLHTVAPALEAAGVDRAAFDPLTLDRSTLGQLLAERARVAEALGALARFEQVVREALAGALPRVLRTFAEGEWRQRIDFVNETVEAIDDANRLLTGRGRPRSPVGAALGALGLTRQLPGLVQAVEGDARARSLLGERFAGRATELEPAFAALTYGRLIKKAGLPAEFERVLLAPDSVQNHQQLTRAMQAVHAGWADVQAFSEQMARFGRFDPAAWLDPAGLSTSAYARALAERTARAEAGVGGLLAWAQYVAARTRALEAGLEPFVRPLETGDLPGGLVEHAFLYRFYASIAQAAFEQYPLLRQFSGTRHTQVRKDFATLDKEIIALRGSQIARQCLASARPPAGTRGTRVDDKTEMELLYFLIPQKKPRVPVRKILRQAGQAIQALKPCFMMGPQAVAQFLEPGRQRFDLVVMDEASQLRPEQALGAIARGGQLVVVGDPKQLPPTSFFSRWMDASEGDGGTTAAADAESILDICLAHFPCRRSLRWHYRSQHESLIAFSNHFFYDGRLVVFPSPYPKSRALGLRYVPVPEGVYADQMNVPEARRVVEAVVEHILERPNDSLGVVTLNIKQRDLVAEMLEERLRSLASADDFRRRWEAEGMELFVKNLENVQGDERDAIIICTTFGKAKGAEVVRQNFGPISGASGWRRLNVLFTRARKSVTVITSMRPEDIRDDNQTPRGTRMLRKYLAFARDGVLPIEAETGRAPDSDFEVAVIKTLEAHGYTLEPQLGVAGFRIDIAVRHPDHRSGYLAAIECDGASYHSAVSVRDRDRIRQEILERLGWEGRIWRIWSTDWFRNSLAETERLLGFLRNLREQPIPESFMVTDLPEDTPVHAPAVATSLERHLVAEDEVLAATLVIEDAADLEADLDDLVSYAPVEALHDVHRIQLTARVTDAGRGLVAQSTPLGAMLMGARVGDVVRLRVPGKAEQQFEVLDIRRALDEDSA